MIESLTVVLSVLGNLLIGALGGGVAGVFVADYLRKKGKVWCLISEWQGPPRKAGSNERPPAQANPGGEASDIKTRNISFLLDMFNEGAIGTGLRGAAVAFHKEGRERPVLVSLSSISLANTSGKAITVINLPPNSWTSIRVYGQIKTKQSDAIEAMDNPDRIEFVGYYPTGKRFSYEIDPERQRALYYAPPLTKYQRGS